MQRSAETNEESLESNIELVGVVTNSHSLSRTFTACDRQNAPEMNRQSSDRIAM